MKDDVLDDDITNALRRLSEFIHDNPELCFKEYRAHNACIAFLQQHCVEGWKITASAYELETAWEAVYTQGTEGRRVVFCSEYDALPQVGHACGHNLICVGGIAAALGAVERLKRHPDIAGQVCILGTPAEEGGAGKYILLNRGAFRDATAAFMLHPSTENVANRSSAAIATCDVTFKGTSAHAAASPWEGENTLDALVLAHSAIGLARQQLRPSDRIHGIVKQGGQAVNIIPEFSSATYSVRSPDPMRVIELQKVLERCCRGCAVATSTAVDIKWTRCFAQDGIFPGYDVHSNQILAQTFQDYMEAHGIKFSSGGGLLANASTDFGGVTYALPAIHPTYEIGCSVGEGNHTYGFTQRASTDYGFEQTMKIADGLAQVGWDMLRDDKFEGRVVAEFKAWRETIHV